MDQAGAAERESTRVTLSLVGASTGERRRDGGGRRKERIKTTDLLLFENKI